MRRLIFFAIILTVLIGAPFSSLATVINFDSLSGGPVGGGEQVTTQYSGFGVKFFDTYSGGAHANNTLTGLIGDSSSPNVLWVDQGGGSTTGQYLEIDFANPINNFSSVFGTSLTANITLEAFDGATLLGTQTLIGALQIGNALSGQISFNSLSDISSVRLFSNSVTTNASFNFSIDNVTFTSTPVPEPATIYLLGAGLAGVGLLRRRFKK